MFALANGCNQDASYAFMLGIQAMADHPEWAKSLQQVWNEELLDSVIKELGIAPLVKQAENCWTLVQMFPAPRFETTIND